MAAKRPRVGHTEDFQEILPLCWWPEQVEYERIRQPVLFGDPVAGRARETGVSESTLRRRIGMGRLMASATKYGGEMLGPRRVGKTALSPR